MMPIPFTTLNWDEITSIEYKGFTGTSFWKTLQYDGLRIRVVEYSEDYIADHWCQLGHVVYCLEGKFESELENGDRFLLQQGMSYVVSDAMSSHRSISEKGAKLLIIDGDFLSVKN